MINAKTVADRAKRIGLGQYVIMSWSEEGSGGRAKMSVLADGFEALVGAILVDGGLDPVEKFVLACYDDILPGFSITPNIENPKGELQEIFQAQSPEAPKYVLLGTSGPGPRPGVRIRRDALGQGAGPRLRPEQEGGGKRRRRRRPRHSSRLPERQAPLRLQDDGAGELAKTLPWISALRLGFPGFTAHPNDFMNTVQQLKTIKKNTAAKVGAELSRTGGLLRLAPAWVPRSFLQPGLRIKLHPDDTYAYGLNRGGIDERWFASTTVTANEGRAADEGLNYCVVGGERFTLAQAVEDTGATLVGKAIWKKYGKWPVYSKFFDNMGPIPHHMHQTQAQAETGRPGRQARELLLPASAQ